jgi:hypothetical protein
MTITSLNDLPPEVLTNIKPSPYDLFAMILVNRRFYDMYTVQLYHSCIRPILYGSGHTKERKERNEKRYVRLLCTILEKPRLASFIRRFYIDHHHTRIVSEYAIDEKFLQGPSSELKLLLSAPQAFPRGAIDILLASLPNVEQIRLSPGPVNLFQVFKCPQLKEVCLLERYGRGNAMSGVATMLAIPSLLHLQFALPLAPNRAAFDKIPDRSSNVQYLTIRAHGCESNNTANFRIMSASMRTIFGKVKSLMRLYWKPSEEMYCDRPREFGTECQELHNGCLKPALAPFKQTLELLQIRLPTRTQKCIGWDEGVIGSLQDYVKLKTIELAPEMMLSEAAQFNTQDYSIREIRQFRATVCHNYWPAGYFSSLLPASLQYLRLYADTERVDRVPPYWLRLIEHILVDHHRLASLESITITPVNYDRSSTCASCMWLGAWYREKCSLCVKSKMTDTMKAVCREAGVLLRIEKCGDNGYFELEDADQYYRGIVPYNTSFDDTFEGREVRAACDSTDESLIDSE